MKTEINLLPIQPLKKKRANSLTKNPFLKLVLGALVLLLMAYGILSFMNQNRLEKIKQVEEVIKNQSGFRIPYENLTAQNELLTQREKVLEALKMNKKIPLNILVGVQDAIPSGVELVDYQFNENGLIMAGNTRKQEEILEFRENLMALGLFKNVTIQNTTKKQVSENTSINAIGNSKKVNAWDFIFEIEVLGVDES